jgi:hypothetical protein
MSFASVFCIILRFVIGHIITSLVDCFVVGVRTCLVRIYSINAIRQCELDGCKVVGKSYHLDKTCNRWFKDAFRANYISCMLLLKISHELICRLAKWGYCRGHFYCV